MENDKMIFDFAMGNPPYQKMTSDTSCTQVWPGFIDLANKLTKKESSLVHPGRWIVPKTTMKPVRDEILENQGLKEFDYHPKDNDLFPDCSVQGGISFTNYEKDYKSDVTYYINGKKYGKYSKDEIFVSNDYEKEIMTKIDKNIYKENMLKRVVGNIGSMGGTEFGIEKTEDFLKKIKESKEGMKEPLKIWCSIAEGKGCKLNWYYIEKENIKTKLTQIFNTRKILISKVGHDSFLFAGNPQIVPKNSVGKCLFIFPENDSDYDLKLIQSLFCTKTARFLMSIIQKDQYVRGFEMIPDYLYFKGELEQMGKVKSEVRAMLEDEGYKYWIDPMDKQTKAIFSDKYFYDKFGFSQKLIDYIEGKFNTKELVEEIKE